MPSLKRFAVAVLLAALLPMAMAAGRLTTDDVLFLLGRGTDQAQIQRMVREADPLEIDEGDLDALQRAGAGQELIAAIRARIAPGGGVLTAQSVGAMLREGVAEAEVIERILAWGRRVYLDAETVLELRRAGAGQDVIAALEGTYVRPGFRVYRHPLGLFSIQYPAEWHEYEWYTRDGLITVVSPETGVPSHQRFARGVRIDVDSLGQYQESREDVVGTARKTRGMYLADDRHIKRAATEGPAGEVRSGKVAGFPAARCSDTCNTTGTACRTERAFVIAHGFWFDLEFVAPADEFDGLSQLMESIFTTFRVLPDQAPVVRLAHALTTAEALERYREAVVQIYVEFGDGKAGFGTGFFVREDGYILTNHHVVCGRERHEDCTDRSKWQLPTAIRIQWDRAVGPRRPGEEHRSLSGVELVGTVYRTSPYVDLALLKAPLGDKPFRALPIAQVADGVVQEGDPVAALGFPLPGRFATGSMFATQGIVSRINYIEHRFGDRGATRRVDDFLTTAEIQPGNSGGPLLDLATGTVIGLNTYVPLASEGTSGEMKELDYFGVVAIDHALQHFPQIARYPRGRLPSPQEHLELAWFLVYSGLFEAAAGEFGLASEGSMGLTDEQRASLYYGRGCLLLRDEDFEAGLAEIDRCLALDPENWYALWSKARQLAARGQYADAIRLCDQCVRSMPTAFWALYERADILREAGRYADALKDIEACIELLPDLFADPFVLRGRVFLAQDRAEEAREELETALAVDPEHVQAQLQLANYYRHLENLDGAEVEFGRALDRHPYEPVVHEEYGRFLRDRDGREKEALEHLFQALVLTLDGGQKPARNLLVDVGNLANDAPGAAGMFRLLAAVWAGNYPDELDEALICLGNYWNRHYVVTAPDCPVTVGGQVVARLEWLDLVENVETDETNCYTEIAMDGVTVRAAVPLDALRHMLGATRACWNAAHRIRGSDLSQAVPLSVEELVHAVEEGLTPDLLRASFGETSIDAALSVETLVRLAQESGWSTWQTLLVLERCLNDQMTGEAALGSLVAVKWDRAERLTWSEDGQFCTVTFSNTGNVPLTDIVLRKTYQDEDGEVLGVVDSPLRTADPVLDAGASVNLEYHFDNEDALRRAGVDPDKVHNYCLPQAVSARNALALRSLQIELVSQTDTDAEVTITNPTPFAVTNPQLRIFYTDSDGDPLPHRTTGRPVVSPPVTLTGTIGPDETSGPLSLGEYATVAGAQRQGVAEWQDDVVLTFRCVGCELSLP